MRWWRERWHSRRWLLLFVVVAGIAIAGFAGSESTFSTRTADPDSVFGATNADTWLPTGVTAARTAASTCTVGWTPVAAAPAGSTYTVLAGGSTVASGLMSSPSAVAVGAGTVSVALRVRYANWISPSTTTAVSCPGWPDAPAGVSAVPDDTSVAVSWTAPVSNGNPVTGYQATATPSGGGAPALCTATAPITTCVITGLTQAADYTVGVVAGNVDGTGPASTGAGFVATADRYWTGAASSSWSDPANWSYRSGGAGGAAVPIASSRVILNGGSTAALTVNPAANTTVQSWTQNAGYTGTVTYATGYSGGFTNLAVLGDVALSAGTWTHGGNGATATTRLRVSIGGNLTVGAAAAIDVQQRGYAPYNGPGELWDGERVVGSHGGLGGGSGSGGTYGDPFTPITLGSGSGNFSGGGAAQLTVTGTTALNGSMNANGTGCYTCNGGSAGGSITLTTGTLTGTGSITANGGNDGWFGNGGGGRIAVRLTQSGATFTATPTMTAYGSTQAYNSAARRSSAGTIYQQTLADGEGNGTLIIDNNGDTAPIYTEVPAGQSWTVAHLITRNNGIVSAGPGSTLDLSGATITGTAGDSKNGVRVYGGTLSLPSSLSIQDWTLYIDDVRSYTGNWTVKSGGRLSHSANGGTPTYRINLTLTGNLSVDPGGAVDVQQRGYAPYNGPGELWDGERVVGSHGGLGCGSGSGGTYGDPFTPITLGSGSGNFSGGGAAQLTVTGTTTLNGSMNANGTGCYTCNGGSAGGSITLTTGTLTGTGSITANGGNDGWFGNGGGGRIAVRLTQSGATFTATPTMTAYGSTQAYNSAARRSSAGTIYQQTLADGEGNGTLIIDNNGDTAPIYTEVPAGHSWTVAHLITRNDGIVSAGPGATLDLSGATITGTAGDSKNGVRVYGGTLSLPAPLSIQDWSLCIDDARSYTGNWTIATGGRITHTGNGGTPTYRIMLTLTGNLTVNTGGAVDVRNRGYAPNTGPGERWSGERVVGSHGGLAAGSGAGGTYGDPFTPVTLGSGSSGSSGGGAAQITVTGTTTVNGAMTADGSGCYQCSGGSAGGSIALTTAVLAGTGSITADGGEDSWFGDGGGGRIAVRLTQAGATFAANPTMSAYGHTNNSFGRNSSAGTVYQQTSADGAGNGTLIIDNNGYDLGGLYTEVPAGQSWTVAHLITRNDGILSAGPGATLDLSGATIAGATGDSKNGVRVYSGTLLLPAPLTVQDWTLYVDDAHSYTGNWTVASGGKISHTANGGTATYRVMLTLTGNLTINTGGAVDVRNRGYGPNSGPGLRNAGDANIGAHGGLTAGSGGGTYGDPFTPITLGSGSSWQTGGGAAQLTVSGSTTVDGTMTADGAGCYQCHGGSAGGSVALTTGTLAGSGTITADGGKDSFFGYGGGGRVSVTLTQPAATFAATPTMSVSGGGGANYGRNAAVGTIYQQAGADAAGAGTLIIDGNGIDNGNLYTEIPAGQSWTLAKLVTRNNGILSAGPGTSLDLSSAVITGAVGTSRNGVRAYGGTLLLPTNLTIQDWALELDDPRAYTGNWTLKSGGRLSHSANGGSADYQLDLTLTGNLTVEAGGAVDVRSRGYAPSNGPGVRSNGDANVGMHGGLAAGSGGGTYGDAVTPITLGSGSSWQYGGGAAKLTVSGTTTVDGTITADGTGCYGCHGGSAGGSVLLITPTLTGAGSITANGGKDTFYGHGGGGRIAVVLTQAGATFGATPTFTAYGDGSANYGRNSAAGTIYLRDGNQPAGLGTLIVDNNGVSNGILTTLDDQSARSTVIGRLILRNSGNLTVGDDDSLSITGTGTTLTTAAGTALVNRGTLTLAGAAPAVAGTTDFTTAGNTVTYTGQSDNSPVTLLAGPYANLTVNKTGTTFGWPATTTTVTGTLTATAGTLNQSTGNLTAGQITIAAAATWHNYGTNTITIGTGGVTANGTLDLDGAGGGPTTGTTTSITIASTTAGTRRNWIVTTPTTITNAQVTDMGDDGTPLITVKTGTNGGNNGTRWTFTP